MASEAWDITKKGVPIAALIGACALAFTYIGSLKSANSALERKVHDQELSTSIRQEFRNLLAESLADFSKRLASLEDASQQAHPWSLEHELTAWDTARKAAIQAKQPFFWQDPRDIDRAMPVR